MDKKTLEILNFKRIQYDLAEKTTTVLGRKRALALEPMTSRQSVEEALNDVDDVLYLRARQIFLVIPELIDATALTKRLAIHAPLNGKELAQIMRIFATGQKIRQQGEKMKHDKLAIKHLQVHISALADCRDIYRELQLAISNQGEVLDSASGKLGQIRRSMRQEEENIRQKLDQMVKGHTAKFLSEAIITIRNDRFVLPVKAEHRQQFGGVEHDVSASGQTVFMEPASLVERNNHLGSLRREEQEEIERILSALSQTLEPYTESILGNNKVLGELDFINAKAEYAQDLEAVRPQLAAPDEPMNLRQARHPFIPRQKVVENDIYFQDNYRMIIVTGPNTGGKTVTLTTVGLCQAMGQAGLFITAQEGSQIEIFADIYADIGDEQSLEQNLSTFSGHLKNIINIIKHADEESLVLIDELGSGTDPQEGAALAMAILDRLAFLDATVLATTHYPELKLYAYDHPSATNASMAFNLKTLEPTYRLQLGEPGRSNALDISRRLGLPAEIIADAKRLLSDESQHLNDMLLGLDKERRKFENKGRQLNQKLQKADQMLHDLKLAHQALQEDKEIYQQRAKEEAKTYLAKKQKQAKKLIHDLREWQKNQGQSVVKEHELIEKQKEMDELAEESQLRTNLVLQQAKKEKTQAAADFVEGEDIIVVPYETPGVIMEKREQGQYLVQMGAIQMVLPQEDLKRQNRKQRRKLSQASSTHTKRSKTVTSTLDLRGQRYEEAMHQLDQFIDAALLANYPQVTIIHGYGTGALREGVQKYLRHHPRIYTFQFAPYNQGGQGATIAKFKN